MKKIFLNKFFFIIFILFFFQNSLKSEINIKIELQIEDEIITNIDIINEQNYLIALNNNLKNIPKNQLRDIAKESLIREKIKKNELLKFFDFSIADKYAENLLEDFYKRLNFKNKNEFINYVKNNNLNIEEIKLKLKIETLWNELIFNKFKDQIKVNEENIKKKIKNQKNFIEEYNLSEILFELKGNEKLSDKYNIILKSIKESGFKNSTNFFSISDSSKFGGDLGWVNKSQLNELLVNQIEVREINQLTKPIQTSSGYLILKLNDKRKKETKIDFNKRFKKLIIKEKNRQLNQFSLIYYNKIKQNIFISEK